MYVTDMIVGLSGGLFLLTGFIFFLRLIQAWLLHRTLREAINRDSTVAESLIERLDKGDQRRAELAGDDRNGLVLIAIGTALFGFALIVNNDEWIRYQLGAALFPLLVGLALLGRHLWARRQADRQNVAAG
jgi:Flp pilus assembly protein TadB